MIKVGKEYHWEMSHRLSFHKGLCWNIHGHSYKMILELEGELDENGMLLDFYEIDKIVLPLIKEYDHSLIVEAKDTKIIEFLKENNFRHKTINYTSTSENLAINFCEQLKPEFSKYKNIKIIRVRVYETVDAYAEVTAKCNE